MMVENYSSKDGLKLIAFVILYLLVILFAPVVSMAFVMVALLTSRDGADLTDISLLDTVVVVLLPIAAILVIRDEFLRDRPNLKSIVFGSVNQANQFIAIHIALSIFYWLSLAQFVYILATM